MKRYAIRFVEDKDLLWSNDEGWTESDNFEVYDEDEITLYSLPMQGEWAELKTS